MYFLALASVVLIARVARSELNASSPSPQAKACTPPAGGSPSRDDAPAIIQTINQCGEGATVTFPANSTYHINSPLTITGCRSCTIRIDGAIKASGTSKNWDKSRCIVLFKNPSGLKIEATGSLDGSGQEA
jgi:galacturan 1,4-alpha-galacturonidase